MPLHVGALGVFPLKGGRGVSLARATVDARGIEHDRRFMLVDASGRFVTQRTHPSLARTRVTVDGDRISFEHGDGAHLRVALRPADGDARRVLIWDDECDAISLGADAARWFSERLGIACELVYMPDASVRQVDVDYARAGDVVGFADGFPVLVASSASVDDLNTRLSSPVPMNRFRANVVIDGGDAWQEDEWRRIRIGSVSFRVVKPCARCAVTTVDQETGEQGAEPMKTLATFRKLGGKVVFGQNAIPDGTGQISLGDEVEIVERVASPATINPT